MQTIDFNYVNLFAIETLKRKLGLVGGGAGRVFIQDNKPTEAGPWVWIQTNMGKNKKDFTVWFDDGK